MLENFTLVKVLYFSSQQTEVVGRYLCDTCIDIYNGEIQAVGKDCKLAVGNDKKFSVNSKFLVRFIEFDQSGISTQVERSFRPIFSVNLCLIHRMIFLPFISLVDWSNI